MLTKCNLTNIISNGHAHMKPLTIPKSFQSLVPGPLPTRASELKHLTLDSRKCAMFYVFFRSICRLCVVDISFFFHCICLMDMASTSSKHPALTGPFLLKKVAFDIMQPSHPKQLGYSVQGNLYEFIIL